MNLQEMDVLQLLSENPSCRNQRVIAKESGLALGVANRVLQNLREDGLVNRQYGLTEKAEEMIRAGRTKRAVILAAGYGMRMIPINTEVPKGLLTVHGEVLIVRIIRQLHEAGIGEIHIVTGYMKERYEYLADAFGVSLLISRDYTTKNNLYSLAAAKDFLEDAYIVPCDLYFYKNPFHSAELYSWYMLSKEQAWDSEVFANRNREILYVDGNTLGNRIVGLAYLQKEDAVRAKARLLKAVEKRGNSREYWELIITEKARMTLPARLTEPEDVVEINTYEQLRELDYYNEQLRSEVFGTIENVLHIGFDDIRNVSYMKRGLTNRSFVFEAKGEAYIVRIPGWGTETFIDRKKEEQVYTLIRGKGLCDDNLYFNPENGLKISRYLPQVRLCDETSQQDIEKCMQLTRKFHEMKLQVNATLDVFEAIQYYEDLWNGTPSEYRDYAATKARCMAMQPFVKAHEHPFCLAHGDCKPDNFLFSRDSDGVERLQLIDWEYAFRCDPLVDLAGFITYRFADPAYADRVIDAYYPEGCTEDDRTLIYAYCALWALQTSNWCEYKMSLGVEVDEFALICYRNAKTFCKAFEERLKQTEGEEEHEG